MTWQPPRPESPPDIASTTGFERRPFPRWVIGLVCVLALAVLIGISVVRGEEYSVRAAKVTFPDESTVAVPMDVQNRRDSDLDLVVRPGELRGYRLLGVMIDDRRPAVNPVPVTAPSTVTVPARTSLRLLVMWQVSDCVRASHNGTTTIYHGPDTIASAHVRTPSARTLLPPVCTENPSRGRPVVDDVSTEGFGADVSVAISVRNTGGRELSFVDAVSASSVGNRPRPFTAQVMNGRAEPDRSIPVGSTTRVVLSFKMQECDVPRRGPADVLLRFRTEPTKAIESLRVHLARTWTSILGVCER